MFDDSGFGSDRYVYVANKRHLSGFVRTLRPVGAETPTQFEERMDILARRLNDMADVQSFTVEIARRASVAVECVVDVTLRTPSPAPILGGSGSPTPPTTAARVTPRGARGSGRSRLALGGI